ncbi:MAG: hypothetical protein NTX52_02210 [Planctomycetota bacterium]|nr:hypothetical protein [Planctomycetota bacterium]
MGSLFVVLVIAGCAAYQYLKGTLVKAFATIIIAICASAAAFGYFETLANIVISQAGDGRFASLIPWAHSLCFVLLFILTFALLQTAASQLTHQPIDLGLWPERIGRVVCGVFLGLIISGVLLTALAMAPLPNNYPYQRYDQRNLDTETPTPKKVLLNADGFATGWFSMMSNGSLCAIRNPRSFAAVRPNFLDQLFLNRHNIADGIPIVTSSQAIEVPQKNGAWFAPEDIKDSDGTSVSPKSGHNLTIVRVGIKRSAAKEASQFTLSQLRLICKRKGDSENAFTGKVKNVYPVGYLKAANQLQKKRLNDLIKINLSDFTENVKWIDFAFYVPGSSPNVPGGFVPLVVEFKLNNIAEVPLPVSADQAPPPVPFVERSENEKGTAESRSSTEQPTSTPAKERKSDSRRGGLSNISKGIVSPQFDENK